VGDRPAVRATGAASGAFDASVERAVLSRRPGACGVAALGFMVYGMFERVAG